MKNLIRLFLFSSLMYGCASIIHKEKKTKQSNEIHCKNGKIVFDFNGNGTYIPNDLVLRDIVSLTTFIIGDSLVVQSEYSNSKLPIIFNLKGNILSSDSIQIIVKSKNFSKGFLNIKAVYKNDEEYDFSFIGHSGKISTNELSYLQIRIFNATSDLIYLNSSDLKDTLEMHIDYLDLKDIERYTFFENEYFYRGR